MKLMKSWTNSLKVSKHHGKRNNSVKKQLKNTFYGAIITLSTMIILLIILLITITFVNQSVFENYGSGQGKVGSLELKFNALHAELRYLIYDSTASTKDESIKRIETLSDELIRDAEDLSSIIKKSESKEAYNNIMLMLEKYLPMKDNILKYETESGKYNSTKLYSGEATRLATELENSISSLFTFMSKQGALYSEQFLAVSVIVTIAACIIVAYMVLTIIKRVNKVIKEICNPLEKLTFASQEIAQGNLQVKIIKESDNEIGILAEGLSHTVEALKTYIFDISDKLQRIVDNDLTIEIEHDYLGDFKPIQSSLISILDFLNNVFKQIEHASYDVYAGASQVSEGAMNLAEGTNEQTTSINEISDSVLAISQNAKSNEALCETADQLSKSARYSAEMAQDKMNTLVNTMSTINETSKQISTILQNIYEIADQTNLLALNAQLEAAKAGEAGRGFTIIANEVAKLASRCSTASKQTEGMIKATLEALQLGDIEVKATAKVLQDTEKQIDVTAEAVSHILEETNKQHQAIEYVQTRISSISDIIKINSASVQESAAASQQLAAQAEVLRALLLNMKLRE